MTSFFLALLATSFFRCADADPYLDSFCYQPNNCFDSDPFINNNQCYVSRTCNLRLYESRQFCPSGYFNSGGICTLSGYCAGTSCNTDAPLTTPFLRAFYSTNSFTQTQDNVPSSSCAQDSDSVDDNDNGYCPNVKVKIKALPFQSGTIRLKCNQ
ncbi:hypothetical protein [Okeania sp. SIO2B3]|uniref:hypothetical protein n=1 Tax=Okeania sp. SIO2B3 TaxID=2607784 RepID=UPI0013C1E6D9|nr:hypothetical protein [Okeania sp. SIO2B3]NET46719.1 hypothetical protein [Okeania sp. SIO2B3]